MDVVAGAKSVSWVQITMTILLIWAGVKFFSSVQNQQTYNLLLPKKYCIPIFSDEIYCNEFSGEIQKNFDITMKV